MSDVDEAISRLTAPVGNYASSTVHNYAADVRILVAEINRLRAVIEDNAAEEYFRGMRN